jgi:hypothetical protein
MAVDAGRYPHRGRWQQERAVKERRQKLILAGATVLLAIVLAIQLPRTLHRGHAAPPAVRPAPAAVAEANTSEASSPAPGGAEFAKRVARLQGFPEKDPFATQGGASATGGPRLALPPAPVVRTSHLIAKDPFAVRVGGHAPARHRAAPSRHRRQGPTGRRYYVVVLASIAVRYGYGAALGFAHTARARGIARARVLRSSAYESLRRGFYVVSGGIYSTPGGARRGLTEAHARGFTKAYTRPLRR